MNSKSSLRWLILIPTKFEHAKLNGLGFSFESNDTIVQTCGFGPIAAAARTAMLLEKHRPKFVLLLGIAGAFNSELKTGHAYTFGKVVCHGVGVGESQGFQSASQLGWKQWESEDTPIGDELELANTNGSELALLTCPAASENEARASWRKSTYCADAEDMEGFAVALACRMANTNPPYIVRGISNRVGDRNKQNWQTDSAIKSAALLAEQILSSRAE